MTSVCASNGVSYASECAMRLAACHLAKDLDVLHAGQCESDDSTFEGSGSGGKLFGGILKPMVALASRGHLRDLVPKLFICMQWCTH